MDLAELPEPRIEQGRPMHVAGLRERYSYADCSCIPNQWERFQPFAGRIPNAVAGAAYGVCCATENPGELDYYAGVEVLPADRVPEGLRLVEIPAQRYAVFGFSEHISKLPQAVQAIWTHWVPASGKKAGGGPSLERYGPEFDPVTGEGGFEIWLPVAAEIK